MKDLTITLELISKTKHYLRKRYMRLEEDSEMYHRKELSLITHHMNNLQQMGQQLAEAIELEFVIPEGSYGTKYSRSELDKKLLESAKNLIKNFEE